MQFSVVALLSLVAVAVASPISLVARMDDIVARNPQVTAEAPAMSNAAGEVVAFDSKTVNKPAAAAGN
ncbi:hypothetical protein BJ875DRAFT_60136 [Amylocarpus encephaloides]|uniref:Uncharacterized protein n=1 Tax=Amylocarpus encephaloides TaxID=45428 RepID=A0A9P7YGJ1_9HELO|nr:hypothetical protein BJ875DRAFT_60136 [Amylocarpus encephaloides]